MPKELSVIHRYACDICGKAFQDEDKNTAVKKALDHEKIGVKKIHVFEAGEEVEYEKEKCKIINLGFSMADHGPVYVVRNLRMFERDFTVRADKVSKRISGETDSV